MMHARRSIPTLAAALALALTACDKAPKNAVQRCEQTVIQKSVATDILFVIDDSLSMSPHQQTLRAALGRFITNLANSPIENDYQIGVTTTSVAEYNGGAVYPSQVCVNATTCYTNPMTPGTPYPRGIVTAVDPTNLVLTNQWTWGDFYWDSTQGFYGNRMLHGFPGMTATDQTNLVADFDNNSLVGEWGSGREQPFEAMRLALSEQVAAGKQNVGFLRPGARLAIVFLADEDDCSGPTNASVTGNASCVSAGTANPPLLVPVADYAAFLQGPIAEELRDVLVAAIVGVTCTNGVCANTLCSGATTRPDRFWDLLHSFDSSHTRVASICDTNFDQTIDDFATLIRSRTLQLDGAPADYRMLVVTIDRNGVTIPCTVSAAAGASPTDVVYEPPLAGRPASLTFQATGTCALQQGDKIDVKVICAG